MITLLTDFVQELRSAGVPVSMVEAIDAMESLAHVDLADRVQFKETLRATLVKNSRHEAAFEVAFEVYFANRVTPSDSGLAGDKLFTANQLDQEGWMGGTSGLSVESLIETLFEAMAGQDFDRLRNAARRAVDQLAGMEPGRPVGGTYYLYRTLRQLDVEALEQRLLEMYLAEVDPEDALAVRLAKEDAKRAVEQLRDELKDEIRRRLVADRGHQAVAKTLRQPSVEEIDLMHATRTDLANIEHVIEPLTRKLAVRLARRRRLSKKGRLDFRKTVRSSLATGGVPVEPRFKTVRPHRPEIFLLCDISGSMATFARFTLQFTYAMATQFSRLRAFVFVDAVDEVTDFFRPGVDFGEALTRIGTEADVVWLDGHSDYGHAFEQFLVKYGKELTPRTTLIVAGDARNNYRDPRAQNLAEIADAVEAVYWLNPEPSAYWDSGDSVMVRYAGSCEQVFEVRNLKQLELFVETVTENRPSRRRNRSTHVKGEPMNPMASRGNR
jgi:hypothetical protein